MEVMDAVVLLLITLVAFVDHIKTSELLEEERITVITEDGRISGFKEHSTKGLEFFTFHAIPYAKPPVGELRFKDPVPIEKWEEVRDGAKRPSVCPQIPFIALTMRERKYQGEEDCLYLSVFSPMTRQSSHRDKLLPVMVFFHGGAFFAGGIEVYNGYVMMNEDVILVLVQYRLGILGFLSTEDSVMPGNFGLKDQTLALRWVQRNIHHFGGDPDRVTLFGESAGGASVHYHLLSPHSQDLYARAIMMSGTLFSPWAMGGAYRDVARHTARLFDCPELQEDSGEEASQDLMRCLQSVDVKNLTLSLMDHMSFNFNPVLMGPRVDGDVLPDEPEVLMVEGRYKLAEVISGITAQEGGLFAVPLYSSERMMSDLVNKFTEIGPASLDFGAGDTAPVQLSQKIFNHYLGGVKVEKTDADKMCQLFGDRHFNIGHDLVSALYARNLAASKIFLYTLEHRGQRSFGQFYDADVGSTWVNHVDDLFYFFTGGEMWKPLERDEDLRLRDILTKLWVNFAATGNPTPDESLGFIWRSATADELQHLSLTPTPAMKSYARREVRAFWETLPTKQNLLLHPEKIVPIPQDETNGSVDTEYQTAFKRLKKWKHEDEL